MARCTSLLLTTISTHITKLTLSLQPPLVRFWQRRNRHHTLAPHPPRHLRPPLSTPPLDPRPLPLDARSARSGASRLRRVVRSSRYVPFPARKKERTDALVLGVSAVYYAMVAERELPESREHLRKVVVPVVLFIAFSSTIAHVRPLSSSATPPNPSLHRASRSTSPSSGPTPSLARVPPSRSPPTTSGPSCVDSRRKGSTRRRFRRRSSSGGN